MRLIVIRVLLVSLLSYLPLDSSYSAAGRRIEYSPILGSVNKQVLYHAISIKGIPYAEYWVALSALETGYWTSGLCKNHFNLFGFNFPKGRASCAKPYKGRFASYASYDESIDDLKKWIELYPPKANEDFFHFISRRKFNTERRNYISHVSFIHYFLFN